MKLIEATPFFLTLVCSGSDCLESLSAKLLYPLSSLLIRGWLAEFAVRDLCALGTKTAASGRRSWV